MPKHKKKQTRWSEPLQVYELAERARLAAILISEEIRKHDGQLAAYLAPIGVVGSWALELYLKCLLFDEKTRIADTHDTVALFNLLTAESQFDIRRIYAEIQGIPHVQAANAHLELATGQPQSFDRDLETTRDSFVRIRYLYETNDIVANFGDLMESIRSRINRLHPEWPRDFRDRPE